MGKIIIERSYTRHNFAAIALVTNGISMRNLFTNILLKLSRNIFVKDLLF